MQLVVNLSIKCLLYSAILGFVFFNEPICFSQPAQQRKLTVSLYPYLPNSSDLYWKIETAFEAEFPDIELEISLASENYYGEGKGSIVEEKADVYELDAVLLKDFIARKKIQPIPNQLQINESEFVPIGKVGHLEGQWWGYPHWVCGNFLMYKKKDTIFQNVNDFKIFLQAFQKDPTIRNGLLIDLTGSSTIGEMYLDGLIDKYKQFDAAAKYLTPENLDTDIIKNLNSILDITYHNFGRINNYHDRLGFYPRQFSKGNGLAYVGYSEQLYYILTESLQSCLFEENCLTQNDIEISEWPLSSTGSQPIGWVDMFVIDSAVKGQTLADANSFIRFMAKDSTYLKILIPNFNEAPRYLLPAKKSLYKNPTLLSVAPLYNKLYPIINKAITTTYEGLNQSLRNIGKYISNNMLLEKVE